MTNKSFAKLLRAYNFPSSALDGDSGYVNEAANRISEWPLQFPRTGFYLYSVGYVSSRTTASNWWSGVAGSAAFAYYLSSYSDNIGAQYANYRGFGFALRCQRAIGVTNSQEFR